MGRTIRIAYVGAFIVPELENFQEVKESEDFYSNFNENDIFRTAYEGLESIDVLIPAGNDYAIKDGHEEEFIIDDFSELKELEVKLKNDFSETINKLKEMYPSGTFSVKSGIVCYFDETY